MIYLGKIGRGRFLWGWGPTQHNNPIIGLGLFCRWRWHAL